MSTWIPQPDLQSRLTLRHRHAKTASTGEFDAAIASITRALELDPGNGWYKKNIERLRSAKE